MSGLDPESQPPPPQPQPAEVVARPSPILEPATPSSVLGDPDGISWVFFGSQGLRTGWSFLIFAVVVYLLWDGIGMAFSHFHLASRKGGFTARSAFFVELVPFLALVLTASLMALIERRRNLLAYNLTGPHRLSHFLSGLVAGFAALSALIGALAWGGWLHIGPVGLSGFDIFKYAAVWSVVFLMVGFVEEGTFRCYLQFTFTRGINFWWALAIVACVCGYLVLRARGNGVWGIYGIALVGLFPCLYLYLSKTPNSGFWQAAWATSTLFGFVHTGNNGENWIGIFAAALIGFVFCVSVRLTGTAWWAIGCHASWDWAETYFYGTADSGLVAPGHYLTSFPAGNPFWSGGADGPEGSVLVLAIILLLLLALILLYGRKKQAPLAAPVIQQLAS